MSCIFFNYSLKPHFQLAVVSSGFPGDGGTIELNS